MKKEEGIEVLIPTQRFNQFKKINILNCTNDDFISWLYFTLPSSYWDDYDYSTYESRLQIYKSILNVFEHYYKEKTTVIK